MPTTYEQLERNYHKALRELGELYPALAARLLRAHRAMNLSPSDVVRFWTHVQIKDGCWEWLGSRTKKQYGKFAALQGPWRRTSHAHRVSWEIHFGPIPAGILVCHRCDNPPCVNPGHLFLGTPKQNMEDRDAKGRRTPPAGEQHSSAKLCAEDVRLIRASTETAAALSARFGVVKTTIDHVRKGRTWKHLK